jgi:hypothetical protein
MSIASLPPDLRVALAPLDTYRHLMARPVEGSWMRALERPALVAMIIGTTVTLSSARRVPLDLVLIGILCWSFVPAIQLLIAAIVIRSTRSRRVPVARALELLFIGHLPWSLWVLFMTGLDTFTRVTLGLAVEVGSLLIPGIWTAVIVSAFCQAVLGCTPRQAHWLTGVHQVLTWTVFFTYVILVSGFWARVLAALA